MLLELMIITECKYRLEMHKRIAKVDTTPMLQVFGNEDMRK